MRRNDPTVSIGVPVYNGERFLAETLDALLGQTYQDFEVVVSDNASSDGTEAICRRYAERDRRVRYERQAENMGASWNFNHVFEISRGKYFRWAADDDTCDPAHLERCLEVLESNPDVLWCHSQTTHIDGDGQLLRDMGLPDISYATGAGDRTTRRRCPSRESSCPHKRLKALMLGPGGCLDVYGLIRSHVIRQTRLMLPYYGSDKVFMAEICLRGRYYEIPEVLFYCRVHDEGSGSLRTAAEQQRFANPKDKRRFTFERLNLLRGYLSAIYRAPLSAGERARCLGVVVQYLFQVRKWGQVVSRTLTGRGTGGGYVEYLKETGATDRRGTERVAGSQS